MKCEHCNAELEEGVALCPVCGKESLPEEQNEKAAIEEAVAEETVEEAAVEETVEEENAEEGVAEESETDAAEAEEAEEQTPKKEKKARKAKKKKAMSKTAKIVLAAVGGVLALGVVVCAVLLLLGFRFRANDPEYKSKYTVSDSKAAREADTVVAKVGDIELTNAEFQMFYILGVMEFLETYSGSLESTYGLNYTEPLYEQISYFEPDQTWEQFFVGMALSNWHQAAVLRIMGEEEGFEMSADMQAQLEGLEESLANLATENGYESSEAILKHDLGAGATVEGYVQYYWDYYYGLEYFNQQLPSLEPTEEEIIAYFEENEETLKESGITKDSGKSYDVRHILISVPTTVGEDGTETSTEEDWAKCLEDAQKLLDQWEKGEATEESFAALAMEYSEDTGSSADGGLYSGLTSSTSFVQEFKDWYLDESRQVGDTGLVKSVYGYHIMYFSGSEEIWMIDVESCILTERTIEMVQDAKELYPMDVSYRKVVLGEMTF